MADGLLGSATCASRAARRLVRAGSAGPLRTADRYRCVRQRRGRVFRTSSNPVEPSALWERHTDLR